MNKTISITLAGLAFNIDEVGFPLLKDYLDKIKRYFLSQEGGKEIVEDIEVRIAEIFTELLTDNKEVINLEDVELVIEKMGQPFEMDEDLEDETDSSEEKETQQEPYPKSKRVFRDPDDKVLGGVSSGVALYLGIDTLWVRLLFVFIAIISFGTGAFIYVILWVAVPEAVTTADKLRMRGQPVNVSNIEQTIKSGFTDIKDGIKDRVEDSETRERVKKTANDVGSTLERAFKAIFSLFAAIVKAFAKVLAVAVLIVCAVSLVGTVISIISASIAGVAFYDLIGMFFESNFHLILSSIGVVLIAVLPMVALISLAVRVIVKTNRIGTKTFATLLAVWIFAIITVAVEGLYHGLDFRHEGGMEKHEELLSPNADRYYIKVNPNIDFQGTDLHFEHGVLHYSTDEFFEKDGDFYLRGSVSFNVMPAVDGQFSLVKYQKAHGRSFDKAVLRAETVDYNIEQTDSSIVMDQYIMLADGQVWRNQEVAVTLFVPEGKEVVFLNEERGVYNRAVRRAGHRYGYVNKVFQMINGKLKESGASRATSDNGDSNYSSYDLSDFSELSFESEDHIMVEVTHGKEYSFKVSKDVLPSSIEIDRENQGLSVEIEDFNHSGTSGPHIIVTMPELTALDFTGAGYVVVRGFTQRRFDLGLTGATEGECHGQFEYFGCEVQGASILKAEGTATQFRAEVKGASKLKAFDLIAETVNLDVTGASSAQVFAGRRLFVDAHGKTVVKYKGNPEVHSDVTGLSEVESVN